MLVNEDTTGLTDDQVMLVETAAKFCDDHATRAGKDGAPEQFWNGLAALGLLGIAIGEDRGGTGGSLVDEAIVAAAIGRAMAPLAYPSSVVMVGHLLEGGAEPEMLPQFLAGEIRIAMADQEPDTPGRSIEQTVVSEDKQGLRLTGVKDFVFDLDHSSALLVTARVEGCDETAVVRLAKQADGLSMTPVPMLDGRMAHRLEFDIRIDRADIVLRGAEADRRLAEARDRGAIASATEAIGAISGIMALTRDHLRTRRQFGRPLSEFQVLRHRFADMAIDAECAVSVVFAAARAAHDPERRGYMAGIAKSQAIGAAHAIAEAAIQLHGGLGMTDEFAVGRYYKRIMVLNATNDTRDDCLDRLVGMAKDGATA